MKTREVMTTGIVTIEADDSVADAMKKMLDRRLTSLIVEEEEGDAHGIITRKDIISEIISERKDPKKVKVAEIMSKPLLIVSPDLDTKYIARLMAQTNVRRFGVIEEGKLIGVISNSDVLRAETLRIVE